jgi:hypothetical protein
MQTSSQACSITGPTQITPLSSKPSKLSEQQEHRRLLQETLAEAVDEPELQRELVARLSPPPPSPPSPPPDQPNPPSPNLLPIP